MRSTAYDSHWFHASPRLMSLLLGVSLLVGLSVSPAHAAESGEKTLARIRLLYESGACTEAAKLLEGLSSRRSSVGTAWHRKLNRCRLEHTTRRAKLAMKQGRCEDARAAADDLEGFTNGSSEKGVGATIRQARACGEVRSSESTRAKSSKNTRAEPARSHQAESPASTGKLRRTSHSKPSGEAPPSIAIELPDCPSSIKVTVGSKGEQKRELEWGSQSSATPGERLQFRLPGYSTVRHWGYPKFREAQAESKKSIEVVAPTIVALEEVNGESFELQLVAGEKTISMRDWPMEPAAVFVRSNKAESATLRVTGEYGTASGTIPLEPCGTLMGELDLRSFPGTPTAKAKKPTRVIVPAVLAGSLAGAASGFLGVAGSRMGEAELWRQDAEAAMTGPEFLVAEEQFDQVYGEGLGLLGTGIGLASAGLVAGVVSAVQAREFSKRRSRRKDLREQEIKLEQVIEWNEDN